MNHAILPASLVTRRPPVRRALLALACAAALAGAVAAAPAPAQACGMRAFHRMPARPQHNPSALLAMARRHLDRKENVSALLSAQQVLDRASADDAERAEAWAIVGWVRWLSGKRAEAVQAVESGREMDEDTVKVVVARLGDTPVSREFKRAVGA